MPNWCFWTSQRIILRLLLALSLFPVVLQIIHVKGFMKFFGFKQTLERSGYLDKHVCLSPLYCWLFNLHRWTSAVWLLTGVLTWSLSYDKDSFSGSRERMMPHKLLGYLYFGFSIIAPSFGEILLFYRPEMAGGIMMYFVLSFTALYAFYTAGQMIYFAQQGDLNRHRRWSLRNWFVPYAAVQTSFLVTMTAFFGMPVNQENYRLAMIITFHISTVVQELVCYLNYPTDRPWLDWGTSFISPLMRKFLGYLFRKIRKSAARKVNFDTPTIIYHGSRTCY